MQVSQYNYHFLMILTLFHQGLLGLLYRYAESKFLILLLLHRSQFQCWNVLAKALQGYKTITGQVLQTGPQTWMNMRRIYSTGTSPKWKKRSIAHAAANTNKCNQPHHLIYELRVYITRKKPSVLRSFKMSRLSHKFSVLFPL